MKEIKRNLLKPASVIIDVSASAWTVLLKFGKKISSAFGSFRKWYEKNEWRLTNAWMIHLCLLSALICAWDRRPVALGAFIASYALWIVAAKDFRFDADSKDDFEDEIDEEEIDDDFDFDPVPYSDVPDHSDKVTDISSFRKTS